MADKKISELTKATEISGSELIPIVQDNETKKVAASLLRGEDNLVTDVTVDGTSVVTGKVANIPAIPTKTSDLANDSDFTSKSYVDTEVAKKQTKLVAGTNITINEETNTISATGGTGGTYTAGLNISISDDNVISATVPSKTSDLTNDSDYTTKAYVDSEKTSINIEKYNELGLASIAQNDTEIETVNQNALNKILVNDNRQCLFNEYPDFYKTVFDMQFPEKFIGEKCTHDRYSNIKFTEEFEGNLLPKFYYLNYDGDNKEIPLSKIEYSGKYEYYYVFTYDENIGGVFEDIDDNMFCITIGEGNDLPNFYFQLPLGYVDEDNPSWIFSFYMSYAKKYESESHKWSLTSTPFRGFNMYPGNKDSVRTESYSKFCSIGELKNHVLRNMSFVINSEYCDIQNFQTKEICLTDGLNTDDSGTIIYFPITTADNIITDITENEKLSNKIENLEEQIVDCATKAYVDSLIGSIDTLIGEGVE